MYTVNLRYLKFCLTVIEIALKRFGLRFNFIAGLYNYELGLPKSYSV